MVLFPPTSVTEPFTYITEFIIPYMIYFWFSKLCEIASIIIIIPILETGKLRLKIYMIWS